MQIQPPLTPSAAAQIPKAISSGEGGTIPFQMNAGFGTSLDQRETEPGTPKTLNVLSTV